MKLIKPNWVEHATGEKQTKSPIYSISVHPDGTRLATGGQDNKVKIWSTLPILDEEAQQNDANHKLLCTMSAHTGPVLTVRWAHHGRYLASGSDDSVVLIWDIDPAGGGRVFGSEEVNVENWKALRRLVGHAADVVDCAWSRDDSMLASVGLDSKINIWDGYSFAHQGFVKGVTWDPVGNYLATQSDDKTVRIWNTETWQCVEKVSKPFEKSPQSTFFRRLSWSPDGAFIAASNAMNGPVFVAAVIEREGWQSEISFVGHQNTIQVAAFNPRLFFGEGAPKDRVNASCMVALGADDYCISIWRNTYHKPLAVLRDIFSRALLDLCWANDGLTLYGCSADGTIMAARFEAKEFPELAGFEATDEILQSYNYKPAGRSRAPPKLLSVSQTFAQPQSAGPEHVNVIVPRKAPPKKRLPLSASMGTAMANGSSSAGLSSTGLSSTGLRPPMRGPEPAQQSGFGDAFSNTELQPYTPGSRSAATAAMFDDLHSSDRKRKAPEEDYGRTPKGRSMGSSRALAPVQELRAPRVSLGVTGGSGVGRLLPVPSIQNVLRVQQEDGAGVLTAENAAGDGHNAVRFAKDGKDQWIDFIPSPALSIVATASLCAVACEDGTIRVYSVAGRHLSAFKLPSPAAELAASREFLLIVTADCMFRVIDTRHAKTLFPPTTLVHLLDKPSTSSNPSSATLDSVMVRPNGIPIVITSEPAAWAYDPEVSGWTQIASAWWGNSPLNEVRTRHGRSVPAQNSPLAEIEQRVSNLTDGAASSGEKPEWWKEAMSIGHYETRLRASRLLESKDEYKHWLREYGKFLGDENFRERAEELVSELMGPVYHLSGKTFWKPTLMGIPKRDLAGVALGAMKTTTALGGWAQSQLSVLKQIQTDEVKWV